MKTTLKFALSLLIGATVLTACDSQDSKTTEKSTALSETATTKTTAVEAKNDNIEVATETKADSQDKQKAEIVETKSEDTQDKTIPDTVVKESISQKQEIKNVVNTTKLSPQNAYLKEQQALLKVLEKQYEEVRCTPEAEKLGENSFCKQEERRLFLEIQRVKDEIRLNQ